MKKAILMGLYTLWAFTMKAQEEYITRVFEYNPAPGQFVGELPQYAAGDKESDMLKKCLDSFNDLMPVSLGGFGGYIVVGFDHTIRNVEGEYDFMVYGNAQDDVNGKSSEPGIILVSADKNKNGLPDDEWYELAGAMYNHPLCKKNYTVTYTRPANGQSDVPWSDSSGKTGYIYYMSSQGHNHPHYPQWNDKPTLSFTGTRLPDNAVKTSKPGEAEYWDFTAYDYGYADNKPNDTDGCKFKIDWAVDAQGKKANLEGIDFVKIYTAVNQQCGWVGELSTEIAGVDDLHPQWSGSGEDYFGALPSVRYNQGYLTVKNTGDKQISVYHLLGRLIAQLCADSHIEAIPLRLPPGIYLVKSGLYTTRICVR